MKFIQHIFATSPKTQNKNANLKDRRKFFSSNKLIGHSKRQVPNQDNKQHRESINSDFYFDKIIEVKLGNTDIIPKARGDKSHMIYEICIITSDFQFMIKKRFSLFNEFYCSMKKQISHLNIPFPRKTILISGTNIEVVTQRYELLNIFIRKIFKQIKQQKNKQLQSRFVSFLSIQEQYQRRTLKSYTQSSKEVHQMKQKSLSVEDTSITFQLRKLNDFNNHQQEIIQRIENYVTFKNHRITNDQIKTLLTGNSASQLKGLLNLSLSIKDQIKSLQLLRFLLDYISPQKKSYHQKIYMQFEKLPLDAFHFNYEKVKNNFVMVQFKQVFFIILELYCQNKIFDQMKILARYPELINQFELWKNLYELNEGNLSKKNSLTNSSNYNSILKKPSSLLQKAKSFQISPNVCEVRAQSLYPMANTQNLNCFLHQREHNDRRSSFKSNNSTSELTIEEEWQNCKMKSELAQNEDLQCLQTIKVLRSSECSNLKSNQKDKILIQIIETSKSMQQCERNLNSWNKLIYDERHDPFTTISRIYIKLNGKSKIFKFKQQDEKILKNNERYIKVVKKRIESHNSIGKIGKQNIHESSKIKNNEYCNGFEQIITIQNIESDSNQQNNQQQSFRKVNIELNFQGQEDYFRSQIMGFTSHLLDYALEAFLN